MAYFVERTMLPASYQPNTMVYPEQKIESIYAEVVEPTKTRSNRKLILAAVAAAILAFLSVGLTLFILSGVIGQNSTTQNSAAGTTASPPGPANPNAEPLWNSRAEQLIESTERSSLTPTMARVNSFVVVSKPQRKPISLRQLRLGQHHNHAHHRGGAGSPLANAGLGSLGVGSALAAASSGSGLAGGSVESPMTKSLSSASVSTTAEPMSQLPAVNGIFWSDSAESSVPTGFHTRQAMHWKATVKSAHIVDIREGCGRMQNRLVELNNQVLSCARYRQNNDQIQGELFSFYLAQELRIPNVVPVVATRAVGKPWSDVTSKIIDARWQPNRPVLLSRHLDDLEPAFIPEMLRDKNRHLHPSDVKNMTRSHIQELVQWSDLILFDYLTANLDRIVNNMYNLQWNLGMMAAPAHNLLRDPKTGLLVFLDNESGLVHGYRLLDKYNIYHKSLLQSLCVFRRQTIDNVQRLANMSTEELGQVLQRAFQANSPGMDAYLPFLPQRSIDTLRQRLKQVEEQVEKCEAQYTPL